MKRITFSISLILSATVSVIAQPGSIDNGSHSVNKNTPYYNVHILNSAYDSTACGLNYTQATSLITTRYNQYSQSTFGHGFPDTLTIAALPTSYVVSKAYLYFIESYKTACSTPIVTFHDPAGNVHNAGTTIVGTDISACWGETGTRVLRADITNAVTTNGNYILDSLSCTSVWEIDGASLVVIYRDLNASYKGTFVIYDGCETEDGGSDSTKLSGFNICGNPVYGRGFVMAGDFQDNVGPHKIILNSDTIIFPSLFMDFDDTIVNFTAGQITCYNGATAPGDCYVVGATGIYYQDTCIICPIVITGTKEIELNDFTVNPNPTKGLLTITAALGFNKELTVSLVNVLGQEIINQTWNPSVMGKTTNLDIQNYSNGVYFLSLQSGDKKLYVKIVKE